MNLTNIRCVLILDYLQTNKIISEKKAISGLDLVKELKEYKPTYFEKEFNKSRLRHCILKLRRNEVPEIDVLRMIGSSKKGYFLVENGENGLKYQENFAISVMMTAIKAGVPKEKFYKVLNELENKQAVEGSLIITTKPYQKKEVHIYSDDLLEE